MKCPVCGNTDGGCDKKPEGAKFFRITLRSNFEEYSNVPCYVRDYVNRHSPVLPVEAGNKEYYYFDLDKRKHRTRVLGGDYNKFLENFDMQPYEHIRFDILKHEAAVMAIALDKDGFSKERIADGFDFEQDSKAIFLSKGVELNPSQIKEINEGVHIRGLGCGGVFIHRFKKTDVVNNGMRIPKTIVSVLGIPEEGAILLLKDESGDYTAATYYTGADGRIRFRTGWNGFCSDNGMVDGKLVLILFSKMDHLLFMSVDVVN